MVSVVLLGHSGNYADMIDTIDDINDAEGPQYKIRRRDLLELYDRQQRHAG